MAHSFTTMVEMTINHSALEQQFDLYEARTASLNANVNYPKLMAEVDALAQPIVLIRHSKKYYVLLDKGADQPKNSDNISFVSKAFVDCDDILIGRLLTRATGKSDNHGFFYGLGEAYYFIDVDTFYEHQVYKAVAFEMSFSKRLNSLFINLHGKTFSPLDIVWNENKKRYSPKFRFDERAAKLVRDPKGALIEFSPGKGKYTTQAINISEHKESSLRRSRTGAIYAFVEQFNRTFDGAIVLTLKEIVADEYKSFSKADINREYQRIYELINLRGGLQIIDVSLKSAARDKLTAFDWPVDVSYVSADNASSEKPTLIVLDPKSDYEQKEMADPKPALYQRFNAAQSIYNGNLSQLRGGGLKSALSNCIKELAIKIECLEEQFLLNAVPGKLWFVAVERKRGQEDLYHILKCENGRMRYEAQDVYYFDERNIVLPEKAQFFETLHYVIDVSAKEPSVCTIVHEQIAVIPDATVLSEQLHALEQGQKQGMSRAYIERYLLANDPKETDTTGKLADLLSRYPLKTFFFSEDFREVKLSYRSKDEKSLFDGYYEETGVLLKASLTGKQNDYLTAFTGHFYDADQSVYFSGMESGNFQFSKGQFNHIRYLEGTPDLKATCLALMQTYFVKHQGSTVLPFPFKYLRAFQDKAFG
ncbi:hypothetical protein [Thalassotalea litorea]|uniref:hypothetical protein n=1 Tax=Thalassotalea litorea TaxID=2020715 RepID=UPI0037366AA9